MARFLTTALHLFVAMMAAFMVGCITALTGSYDHWGNRYVLKTRHSRLIRERARQPSLAKGNAVQKNSTPYRARKVNKKADIYIAGKAA
ncbi:hypothetical protein [Mucilaginibacter psychrotolerans]|uniref:Uncharacterized protein n=1 Tax=Mucilaginibacter psychrotolerans TaxID=1524096 RepID=A0A4Y8RYE5_9SPHI|nr:hypothetical protein [Mucilaginibacter psychrotolerans]TFF30425.1 hypothetical protein E2R66_27250 [Mucilaginibacter psychrotolerans]